jgi:PAS domain S-box-containing protein
VPLPTRNPCYQKNHDRFSSEVYIQRLNQGNGAHLWFIASPLYNSRGEVVGAIESIRDITSRKHAEIDLSDSKQRLNDIINFLPDATLAIDRDGKVIVWNRAIEEMTGIAASEMLGKGDHEYALPFYGKRRKIFLDLIFHPDDEIAQQYSSLVREKDTLIAETDLSRPKGRAVSLMVKASPLYNTSGEVVGAIESMRDISALRRAEEQATRTRKDWETIFRAIGHPAIILDRENRIIDANDAMVRAAKKPLAALLGKPCYDVFHGPGTTGPPHGCPFEQLKTCPSAEAMEEDIEALGGHYHVSCTPVYDAEGKLEKVIHIAMDVTDRHRIQEELRAAVEQMSASQEQLKAQFEELAASEQRFRESEARYRELADMLPQIVFEMDLDGKVTYGNRCAIETFGLAGDNPAAGIPALDAIHPSDHARIRANMEKMVRGTPFEDHEYTAVRSDGSTFPVVVYSTLIKKEGRLVGFRGIMADISDAKRAEEALRESESKFKSLFNNASDAIYIHGMMPDGSPGQFLEVNDLMCSRLGYTRDELLTMTVHDIVSDAHKKKMAAIKTEMNTTGHFTFLAEHKRKDGTTFPVEVNARRIIINDRPVILAVAREITGRKEPESMVRPENPVDGILQNLPAGIFRATAGDSPAWVMANPTLAQIFGFESVEELIATPLVELFADTNALISLIGHLLKEGAVVDAGFQMKRTDGAMFWISLSAVTVFGPDNSPGFFDGILFDITKRKTWEVASHEASQKLMLLTSLTRHDIRNQLMMLQGYVQLMAAKESDPGIGEHLNKIRRITDTIFRQIDFSKDYQELGIKAPGWLFLDDVIEKTGTPLNVTLSGACKKIEIFADPMLERVFFTLFDNAVRHGDHVTQISIQCEPGEDSLRIIIEDNGCGIPEKDKPKIFDHGFGKNTGLGLFLAKEILAITGITISETGTPGKGARFEILVPNGAFRIHS